MKMFGLGSGAMASKVVKTNAVVELIISRTTTRLQ
eukprot:COSAG06_NODE_1428_length_9487_cov_195.907861_13_plen_35_part_00